MASSYPTNLDNLSNPASSDFQDTVPHNTQHGNANDAIEAIQGTLGVSPNGASATVKARLDAADLLYSSLSSTVTGHTASIATNAAAIITANNTANSSVSTATTAVSTANTANAKMQVVTSSTRPGSPTIGSEIRETDTGRKMWWDGSAWRGVQTYSWAIAGTAVTGITSETTCATLVIPDQGCAGVLRVIAHNYSPGTVLTDSFQINVKKNGSLAAASRFFGYQQAVTTITDVAMTAGSGITLTTTIQRLGGSGTISTSADPVYNSLLAQFFPT